MRAEFEGRDGIVEAMRVLSDSGQVTGTAGNVSIRLDDEVLITPSSVDYDVLDRDMVATVSMTGEVLSGRGRPSSELLLHLAIYNCTDAKAVVHTHAPFATAVGLVTEVLPAVHYAIRTLGGPVRVAPYALFGSQELADNVTNALTDRRAVLMRNHGAVVYGDSLHEALDNAERVEWLAAVYHRAALLGSPSTLSEAQLNEVTRRARELVGYS